MATPLQQQRTAPTPIQAPKLSLARVSKGRVAHPLWIHVYGQEGVGKTSFGAAAPDPIFLDVEQGSLNIETTRFLFEGERSRPNDFEEFGAALRAVEHEGFPTYKTVVIDTLDAVEALIWEYICRRDDKPGIIAYGYAKGENYVAVDEWRKVIAAFERIRAKGMNVITLSHAMSKRRDDPDGEGWDRYLLKLHEKAAGLIKERADAVLFARREIVRTKKDGKVRAVDTDTRLLCCNWSPRYDAKNRHDLPETLALDWGELAAAIASHRPADSAQLVESIKRDAKRVGGAVEATALRCVAADAGDAVKMSKLRTWLNTKLAEAGVEEEN
jgi:AAA domain